MEFTGHRVVYISLHICGVWFGSGLTKPAQPLTSWEISLDHSSSNSRFFAGRQITYPLPPSPSTSVPGLTPFSPGGRLFATNCTAVRREQKVVTNREIFGAEVMCRLWHRCSGFWHLKSSKWLPDRCPQLDSALVN